PFPRWLWLETGRWPLLSSSPSASDARYASRQSKRCCPIRPANSEKDGYMRSTPRSMRSARRIGPLFIALVLLLHGNYQTGYALLSISGVLALASLAAARLRFPLR